MADSDRPRRRADGQPIRVSLSLNYAMDSARERWASGLYPANLIWSGPHLERAGYDVRYMPYQTGRTGRWVTRLTGTRLGEPGPQAAVLKSGADVHYTAATRTLAGIGLLRRAHLLGRPVLAVEHSVVPDYSLYRQAALGYDIVITFSPPIHRALLQLGRDPSNTLLAPWGPDLHWAKYDDHAFPQADRIVSTGKTLRDQPLLLAALAEVDFPAIVYGERSTEVPRHVTLVEGQPAPLAPLRDLQRACIIAVPLADTRGPYGVTEIDDALAMAKPIVATRNDNIGFDIEEVGCGIWVEPGDRRGWVDALNLLLADPGRRAAMGAAGRRFAEQHWNADLFGAAVVAAVDRLAQGVA